MCSRGERKQDACARVSQDETRPASRCRCPAATRRLASTRRGRKTGQAVPHCTETTQRLLVPSSVMTRLNRDPRVAEERNENASGCVSDTALFFFGAERLEQFQNVTQIQVKDFMFHVPMHRLVGLVGETAAQTQLFSKSPFNLFIPSPPNLATSPAKEILKGGRHHSLICTSPRQRDMILSIEAKHFSSGPV